MEESTTSALLIIGVVAFIGGIIYIVVYIQKKQIEKLKGMAERFGFAFTAGKELRMRMKEEIQKQSVSPFSFSKRMEIFGRSWDMVGTYNSVMVHIYPILRQQGKRTVAYTKITALFKKNLNSGLQISKEGFFSKIGKALGGQDLQTGMEEFDKKFIIKGTNESVVLPLLQRSEIQNSISTIFDANRDAFVNDEGIGIERYGTIMKEEVYRALLDQLTGAVKVWGV